MIFGPSGARVLGAVFLGVGLVVPPRLAAAFVGRGLLRIRSRRLGGRAVGRSGACRLYRVNQSDEVDVQFAQYFVNSSLAPVLLFRRRLMSVSRVLGIMG